MQYKRNLKMFIEKNGDVHNYMNISVFEVYLTFTVFDLLQLEYIFFPPDFLKVRILM